MSEEKPPPPAEGQCWECPWFGGGRFVCNPSLPRCPYHAPAGRAAAHTRNDRRTTDGH